MKHALLLRQAESNEGTFGTLRVYEDGALLYTCFTGELPNRDNQPRISCIPLGIYSCRHWCSQKFPNHFEVMNVPERTAIIIHEGNFCGDQSLGYKSNAAGCILVGRALGTIQGQQAVLNSKLALNDLRNILGEASFSLEIKESL